MFKYLRKKKMKGQSTLEYAILIIIIIGALIAIQQYVKRGIQGRLKQAADDIGDQFSPGNTNAFKTTTVSGETTEKFKYGVYNTVTKVDESTVTTGSSNIIDTTAEFWGVNPK